MKTLNERIEETIKKLDQNRHKYGVELYRNIRELIKDMQAELEKREWKDMAELKQDGRSVLIYTRSGICIAPALQLKELTKDEKTVLAKEGIWPDHYNFRPLNYMELPTPPNEDK